MGCCGMLRIGMPGGLEITELKQSGISLNLRTGPTGHATLFEQ